jgi:hypothetical protein
VWLVEALPVFGSWGWSHLKKDNKKRGLIHKKILLFFKYVTYIFLSGQLSSKNVTRSF